MTRSGTTVETPQGNLPGHTLRNELGRPLDIPAKSELGGEHIGGAGGKYPERDRGIDHPIHHLVDRAITAGNKNASCPPLDGHARNFARGTRPGCGYRRSDVPGVFENGGRAL
jgi:hypothetical protein